MKKTLILFFIAFCALTACKNNQIKVTRNNVTNKIATINDSTKHLTVNIKNNTKKMFLDLNSILLDNKIDYKDSSTTWAASVNFNYKSSKKQQSYLAFTFGGAIEVSLNKKSIYKNKKRSRLFSRYKYYIPLNLNKGNNSIEFTIDKKKNHFGINYQVCTEEDIANTIKQNYFNSFLNQGKIDEKNTLKLTKALSPIKKLITKLEISEHGRGQKRVISEAGTKETWKLDSLPLNQSFIVKLYIGKTIIQQPLYTGTEESIFKNFKTYFENANISDEWKAHSDAYLFRINELFRPKVHRGKTWERRLAMLFDKLSYIKHKIEKKENAFQKQYGVNLLGFTSRIDTTLQHMIVIAPDNINQDYSYPLIVIPRAGYNKKVHFLRAPHLANIVYLNHLQALADKYQFLIVISSNRTYLKEPLQAISEKDILESIGVCREYFTVDTTKLFLAGHCLGAEKALSMAERHPNKFSGLYIISPTFSEFNNHNFSMLKKMPIILHHDIYDRHTSINNSIKIIEKAEVQGLEINTRLDNYSRRYYYDPFLTEEAFVFFSQICNK